VSSTIVLCSIQRRIGSLVSCHCNVVHGLRGLCSASFYSRDRLAFSLVDRASHQVMSVMMIYEACLSKHLNTEEVSSDDVEKKFLFSIDIL